MFDYEVKGKVIYITLENGKVAKAMTSYVENMAKELDITMDEAVYTWLEDEGYILNEEQEELTKKAKENKVITTVHKAEGKARERKKVERKPNPDKEFLIKTLFDALSNTEGCANEVIENVGKLITFEYNGKKFKLDLIETRTKKEV